MLLTRPKLYMHTYIHTHIHTHIHGHRFLSVCGLKLDAVNASKVKAVESGKSVFKELGLTWKEDVSKNITIMEGERERERERENVCAFMGVCVCV